jgi:hypothetical protein
MLQRGILARGFAVIEQLFERNEISALQDDLANAQLERSRAGAQHVLGNETVAKLAKDSRLLEIARHDLGSDARPFRATLFDKSPTSNWLVVCIRTRRCRRGSAVTCRAGVHGL